MDCMPPSRPAKEPHPRVRESGQVKPSEPPAHERRRHERLSLTAEVGLRSESNFYTGFSDDISEGGLFIATYSLLPIGSTLEISFGLPTGDEIVATGEVRWVRDPRRDDPDAQVSPGMGVRFTTIKPEHLAAIRSFMQLRDPIFYDEGD